MIKLDKTVNLPTTEFSKDEIEKWRVYSVGVLTKTEYKKDIALKAGDIISQAIKGWTNASTDFGKRVKQKLGAQRVARFEGRPLAGGFEEKKFSSPGRTPETTEQLLHKETMSQIEEIEPINLFSPAFMSSEELKFVQTRTEVYGKEFDFNESSDQVLLQQILIDELIIRRISMVRLSGEDVPQTSIDKIMERFRKNLEKLGVLRVQRLELNTDIQGNVGQLSLELDKKLERIRKLKPKEQREALLDKIKDKLIHMDRKEILQFAEESELQAAHDLEYPDNEILFDVEDEEDG